MASNGIRDRVAIVGMGCTRFAEHWDKSASDLLVDATKEATASAGIDLKMIDAFWLGTLFSGQSGLTLSRPLKIDYKPVSRLENFCATGSEAFRNACYAVASGAYDIAMATAKKDCDVDNDCLAAAHAAALAAKKACFDTCHKQGAGNAG